MMNTKNVTAKALQAAMAKAKKTSKQALVEWEMACNTNSNRGKTYDQNELLKLYDRYGDACGATKATHTDCHNGNEFEYIVVKRHRRHGYLPEIRNEFMTGNQMIDEINCWERYASDKEKSDLLCPILKSFTSKSDKVSSKSEKMQFNVLIIAQKAVYVSDAASCCKKAYKLNNGKGETPEERYEKLKALSKENNWRDAMYNGGNSGVIFDYSTGLYKAVFIDYAL